MVHRTFKLRDDFPIASRCCCCCCCWWW